MAPTVVRSRSDQHMKKQELHQKSKGNKDGNSVTKVTEETKEGIKREHIVSDGIWVPSQYTALKALLSARLCSAIWGLINDCDETFNYWEPTHYLLYGSGFQTWEYAPQYALRSYLYLLIHAVPAWFYSNLLQPNRILVFFFMRCLLALVCSASELYFYRGVCLQFGGHIGRLTLGFLIFSAGMFISATAFLPSSFAMYMILLSMGAWFRGCTELAIFTAALSALLGWPFACALSIPLAADTLLRHGKLKLFVKWACLSAFLIMIPMVQVDSFYYGRVVIAPLNLLMYNVLTSHGPDIYGTAPASYYIINGLLNFNVVFVMALLVYPVCWLASWFGELHMGGHQQLPVWLSLSPMYVWLGIFIVQPHKEERFLFPVYPLICLASAVTLGVVEQLCEAFCVKFMQTSIWSRFRCLGMMVMWLAAVMSISRIVGQYKGYHAPFDIFLELNRISYDEAHLLTAPAHSKINVCIGREWHRFPSSFFLPDDRWELQFIKSEFRGQLPRHYEKGDYASSHVAATFNDMNKEEISRYVDINSCHFLVDIDYSRETTWEPRYSLQTANWTVIYAEPFLNAERSNRLLRAFYIPFLTEKYCSYVNYVLLQNVRWMNWQLSTAEVGETN